MPDDLKAYEAPRFNLFTPDEALAVLVWLLFIAWLADRFGWLA